MYPRRWSNYHRGELLNHMGAARKSERMGNSVLSPPFPFPSFLTSIFPSFLLSLPRLFPPPLPLNPVRGSGEELQTPQASPSRARPPNAFVQYLVQICAFFRGGGHSGCVYSRGILLIIDLSAVLLAVMIVVVFFLNFSCVQLSGGSSPRSPRAAPVLNELVLGRGFKARHHGSYERRRLR